MAWTYDSTDLDNSTASGRLNIVRYLVGDTNTLDQQVQNEEITFALSEELNDVYAAAAFVAKTIAAKYARMVTTELDGQLMMEYSDLASNYSELSMSLEAKSKSKGSKLGVGGKTSESSFIKGQFNNPPFVTSDTYTAEDTWT